MKSKAGFKNLYQWILKRKYMFLLGGIILLSIFLRFVNYDNRWGLAADQARDVLVVREALQLHTIPLIGPFSASGPYVFGPYWYWLLMIPVGLFPHVLIAPWIFLTLLYVFSVWIMFCVGKKLFNHQFGIILALLTAVSPVELQLSTNLIMSSFVGFLSICIFYFFVYFLKEEKLFTIACMSFLIGIAINTHFEAIPLLVLIPVAFIFGNRKLTYIFLSLLLLAIPFLPLAIFDIHSNFYELRHIFLTNAPKTIFSLTGFIYSFLKREITFFITTLPKTWERVTVGYNLRIVGNILVVSAGLSFIWIAYKKRLQKEVLALFISGLCIFFILGGYGGVIYDNFLAFTYPLFLILTTWMFFLLMRIRHIVGIAFLSILLFLGLLTNISTISHATNIGMQTALSMKNKLEQVSPQQTYTLYDYMSSNKDKALALSLLLDTDGKINETGEKVGYASIGAPIPYIALINSPALGLMMYQLDNTDSALSSEGFISYTPHAVYDSVENWYR